MTKHLTLLGHRMTRIFSIFLFIGLAWGQDEYPFFSDMSKQLEFERTKIIIEEGEDVQQIISGGGSQFNWWSLIAEREPIYKNAPIETSYKYHQYFDVKIDNKSISEIKMLKIMGLNNEADRILNDYRKQLEMYKQAKQDSTKNPDYWKTRNAKYLRNGCMIFSIFLAISNSRDAEGVAAMGFFTLSSHINYKISEKQNPQFLFKRKMRKPTFRQVLSPIQTKSLVDAYNRKLYNDISKR